ncbi:hypothetical protein [Arthrobacter sp. 9MFCol3.1]|uniref:hypothetical protein n=1 Tax=Arthrobacter sp. 9MFCol3.1 TaxID=1150398 RepID=UPI0004793934|nr:hypothetical protein [Arthrobacter sp. 9MFCol3.1]
MAAAFVNHAATALRRGFLLVGLLAVVAGFLGMHIMTGMHGAHATTAVTSSTEPAGPSSRPETNLASDPAAPALHAGTTAHDSMAPAATATAGPEPAGNTKAATPSASCVCQSSCTDPASMHSACVPSAAVTSLAAPPPGMAPASMHNPDTHGDAAVRAYSYLPASPSPGDLSISRT